MSWHNNIVPHTIYPAGANLVKGNTEMPLPYFIVEGQTPTYSLYSFKSKIMTYVFFYAKY